ncbi:hypothetical protein [Paenarthrobacter sp. YIM B13468]|uniref:hypothetical protein n=1 Tax=Paenarthrobacter sp. YIM B13468 TaxID=3366295 RepID=UPI003672B745
MNHDDEFYKQILQDADNDAEPTVDDIVSEALNKPTDTTPKIKKHARLKVQEG